MKRHFAWIGTDGVAWDFNETVNDAIPPDPWEDQKDENKYIMRQEAMEIWAALPQDERSWFLSYAVMP